MKLAPRLIATAVLMASGQAAAQGAYDVADQASACALDVVEALGDQGEWMTLPDYGPAWRPYESEVGQNFVPFVTGGAWVLRNGQQYFSSRWSWGEIVFTSGRWTLKAKQGWVWIPDERCVKRSDPSLSEDDPMPLPPLLNPIKVRTIKHPLGMQFAYPYGQEWGRVFPAGTSIVAPRWMAPMPVTPQTLVRQ